MKGFRSAILLLLLVSAILSTAIDGSSASETVSGDVQSGKTAAEDPIRGCPPKLLERMSGLPAPPIDFTGQRAPSEAQRTALAELPSLEPSLVRGMNVTTCNIVGHTVQFGAATATVMPVGQGAETFALLEHGSERIDVTTLASGEVVVDTAGVGEHEDAIEGGGSGATGGCAQSSSDTSYPVQGDFHYLTNVVHRRPAHMTHEDSRFGFRSGFVTILTTRSDCGFPDIMQANAIHDGDTTRVAGTRDGRNVMSFDHIAQANVLGLAFTWQDGTIRTEGDVALDTDNHRLVPSVGPTCGVSFDIPNLMSHEVGHIYGLRDVSGVAANALTMFEQIRACETHKITLGRGDFFGLEDLYR